MNWCPLMFATDDSSVCIYVFSFSFHEKWMLTIYSSDGEMIQSEISLCRVYKRSGIDDSHGQSSSSTQKTSSGRRISSRTSVPTGRHGSSPSSTLLSPTQQLSSFHLLQGECSSASPPAPIMDHQVVTLQTAPPLVPPPRPCTYAPAATIRSTAAAPQRAQGAAAIIPSSTYSLLNMAAAGAAPMAGSSRPIDELSTLVGPGPSQAYANLAAVTGSHFLPLMPAPPPPMPQMTPLGALPMVAPPPPSVTDKLSWDWNPPVPDTTARDYNASGFK